MTVTTLASLLDHHGTGLREADVVSAAAALLSDRLGLGATGPAAALSPDAEEVLRTAGGVAEPQDKALALSAQDTTAAALAFVASSRSVGELAAALAVDASRVRHRVGDGALYAVKVGRTNRFPAWQLDSSDRPIPGLREVLAALPADLHPLEAARRWRPRDRRPAGRLVVGRHLNPPEFPPAHPVSGDP